MAPLPSLPLGFICRHGPLAPPATHHRYILSALDLIVFDFIALQVYVALNGVLRAGWDEGSEDPGKLGEQGSVHAIRCMAKSCVRRRLRSPRDVVRGGSNIADTLIGPRFKRRTRGHVAEKFVRAQIQW